MTIDPTRHVDKFTSLDGALSFAFPTDAYEYEPSQPLREVFAPVAGAHYAYDLAGAAPWAKEEGEEPVRFVLWGDSAAAVDAAYDACLGALMRIGLGKLWSLGADGSRRWCYAKLAERPAYRVTVDDYWNVPVEALFKRYSDWHAETPVTGSQSLTGSPVTFTIANPGNARTSRVVLRLRANSAGGFVNPVIENLTLAQRIATTRDAGGADSELRLQTEIFAVEFSDDDGASYSNDYDLVSLADTQAMLIELEPGNNAMRVTGCSDAVLEWEFDPAYH